MNGCTDPVIGSVTKLAWWCEWYALYSVWWCNSAMQPVVRELRRPRVQQEELRETGAVSFVAGKPGEPQPRHPVHERDHQRLEQ